MGRRRGLILSLVTVLLCTAAAVLAGQLRRQAAPFPFARLADASAEAAEAAYQDSGETEDLIYLLKVLCAKAETSDVSEVREKIAHYGTELLALAKEEAIDLAELGEADDTLLELLRLIRGYGAS